MVNIRQSRARFDLECPLANNLSIAFLSRDLFVSKHPHEQLFSGSMQHLLDHVAHQVAGNFTKRFDRLEAEGSELPDSIQESILPAQSTGASAVLVRLPEQQSHEL
jgi:hypothetical protein